MSPMARRIATHLAVLVAGLVVGALLAFIFVTKPISDLQSLTFLLRSDEKAYVLYRYASYPVARGAILEHVRVAEALAQQQKLTLGKGTPFDLMLWYGRLAVAAERAGSQPEAPGFIAQGLAQARRFGGGDVTESQLREFVAKRDAEWDAELKGSP